MIKLTKQQIINMHNMLLKEHGGLEGIRDDNLLESSLISPFQTFGSQELYPTIQSKASMLCFNLIKNHCFLDGNKRIGIMAMFVFLELNGIELDCTNKEIIDLGLGVASGKIGYEDILQFILKNMV